MSSVQSIERAFAVLRCLAIGPAGVSDIADRTDLPKSTVARLLSTMVELGAVEQSDPNGVYALGELINELSSGATPTRNLVALARPALTDLVVELGEAAGVGVLDGSMVHYLDQVSNDHEVQVRNWSGERVDAHAVSSGLVLLAFAPDPVRAAFLRGSLRAFTPRTVTEREQLEHRLDGIRSTGFAWVFEEFTEGLNSVAAPVFDHTGSVVAAVHAHGPSYRFPGDRDPTEIASLVVAAAERVTARLNGHRPD